MRQYDPSHPLIFIHIPKAAGISVKEVFKIWFPDRLYPHYFDEVSDTLPPKYDLTTLHSHARPAAVYGHFNSQRGFGVAHYYPDVRQFITILRDPFELAISTYYYIRSSGVTWKDQARVPQFDLLSFLRKTPPNMLNHLPRPVTHSNYRDVLEELFVEVGTVEYLTESMRRIAAKLTKPFDPAWLMHLNATLRDQPHPEEFRAEYAEQYPLEFEVYDYVRAQFGGKTPTVGA